jgi:tRNA pseudouridine38-40 synthase
VAKFLIQTLESTVAISTQDKRLALCVEYDGSVFNGWQTQLNPALSTVQETLESALSRIADHPVKIYCAGRTDAGVHANGQIVHFDTSSSRPLQAWVHGTNSLLNKHVCVRWAHSVPAAFHARFSAQSRRYRYSLFNSDVRPALLADFVTHYHLPLDAQAMHTAGQLLLGENDFTSYRAVACQSRTPMRNLLELNVARHAELVVMEIEANAFLLHMVRNIMGVLLSIGNGRKSTQWAREVLDLRDRNSAGVTAPARGLSLIKVQYPAIFNLPSAPESIPYMSFLQH